MYKRRTAFKGIHLDALHRTRHLHTGDVLAVHEQICGNCLDTLANDYAGHGRAEDGCIVVIWPIAIRVDSWQMLGIHSIVINADYGPYLLKRPCIKET